MNWPGGVGVDLLSGWQRIIKAGLKARPVKCEVAGSARSRACREQRVYVQ